MATDSPRVLVLRQAYAGYAPGTQFYIRRTHVAAVLTATPVDYPLRAITIPIDLLEESSNDTVD